MSDRKPAITGLVQAGCLIYMILGSLWCIGNLWVWFIGPCPAFSSNTECNWSRGYVLWLFPFSQLAFLMFGYLLLRIARSRAEK
ncbi:MAG: hypothetical protein IE934_17595 [Sphingopyxis sp.]|nr:hypothetical protein [Sphingopyxis sp.]